MAAELFIPPSKALDTNANPYSGAKWFFYQTKTTTPLDVYTTSALSTAHANPVVSDSSGKFPNIYFDVSQSYRAVLKNSDESVIIHDIDPITSGTFAVLAAQGGASLIGFKQIGTGTDARTLQSKLQEAPSLLDFIPAIEHAGIQAGTSTYDCSADITAALAAYSCVYVPEGRYIIGAMVEIGAGGIGQVGLECAAGVEFRRLDTGITTPLFWLKSDDAFLLGTGRGASKITTAARCPDGLVLIGHRNMTTSHANVFNCKLSGFRIIGSTNYGQTTGNPDVAVKLCNPQLGGLASYFHVVENLRVEAVNYGIHLQGFANANFLHGIEGWYIGNSTLSTARALFYFDGAQQNTLLGCFFHFSPGSDCLKFRNNDNTAVSGGFLHVPSLNLISGQTEQDPAGLSGYGIDAPDASCTGNYNNITLMDNIASNNIGPNFAANNSIRLLGSQTVRGTVTFKDRVRGIGYVADGDITLPTDRTTVGLFVETSTQRGQLRTIFEGTDWRRQEYLAREHYWECNGNPVVAANDKGFGYVAAQYGAQTQATSKSTTVVLNTPTGDITMNAANLAADTSVSFTLTNNKIEANDHVVVSHVSGGTVGSYTATAVAAAGSATVTVRNVTPGALAEAIVLKFTVIKASAVA